MVDRDTEIESLARDMIAAYGAGAAHIAAERLNEMIDGHNVPGRDLWACVVHRIHEQQGAGPVWAERYTDWRNAVRPPAH